MNEQAVFFPKVIGTLVFNIQTLKKRQHGDLVSKLSDIGGCGIQEKSNYTKESQMRIPSGNSVFPHMSH